jgi:tRNA pseudouridine38-40 synthase
VQDQLRSAAAEFFGVEVDLQGAGRTDAGVHALAQVAHLRVRPPLGGKLPKFAAAEILRNLNSRLPADVCVLAAEDAPNTFHARHDAQSRTYLYQISTRRTAFFKKYVWWVKERLDVPAMSRAAAMLAGRHNFAAFRADDPSRASDSPLVTVDSSTLAADGELLLYRITASHFLWRMVRRIVGALVKIGLGEMTPEDLLRLLNGKPDPRLDIAAWTAPASGLFLESVAYAEPGSEAAARRARERARKFVTLGAKR